jgi:hypothetical protein
MPLYAGLGILYWGHILDFELCTSASQLYNFCSIYILAGVFEGTFPLGKKVWAFVTMNEQKKPLSAIDPNSRISGC